MRKALRTCALGALAALASLRPALAGEEPSATPSRPTVTSGAAISEPGWLEIELGIQRTRDASSGTTEFRDSVPYLLKYALDRRWALWLGGDAVIRDDVGGTLARGVGDTTFTVKHRFEPIAEGHSAGFELSIKLPTASDTKGLGSGERDLGFRAIYGLDLPGSLHLDANLGVTRLGLKQAGTGRESYLWAAAVSRPATEALTVALDLSGTRQSGTDRTRQLMLAGSYAFSRRVVADAGVQWGLNGASPDWTVFAGVTVLLTRL